jgi:uncharacterized protein YtpQ (UPF0354 family)
VIPSRIFAYIKADEPAHAGPVIDLDSENDLLVQGFVGRLIVTLAHDDGSAFTLLQRRHLAALGMTEPELFDLGLRNLKGLVDAGQVRLHAHGCGYAVIGGGNFEASTLLLPSVWAWVCDHIGARRLLAVAPARDVVMVVDANSVAGRAELDALIARLADVELDHPLSRDRYLWTGSHWVVDECARG